MMTVMTSLSVCLSVRRHSGDTDGNYTIEIGPFLLIMSYGCEYILSKTTPRNQIH